MPRKPLRSVITPEEAPGLVAVTQAMHTAVCEHVLALTYNAQARIMNPAVQSPDERKNGQHEQRILALSRAISQATLALSRLPVPTEAGLVVGPRSVGVQAPHYPATKRLLEGILYIHDAAPETARPKTLEEIMSDDERLFRQRMAPLIGAINRGELPGQPNARTDWEERVRAEQAAAAETDGLNNVELVDRMHEAGDANNLDFVDRLDASAPEEAYSRPFGSSQTPTLPLTRQPSARPRVRVL